MSHEKMQGGSMGGADDLYREVILDHFKAPKNRGLLPDADAQAEGMNPLCGDQLVISVIINDKAIKDVKFEGHGCAISQSTASMMTQLVKGKSIEEVKQLTQVFKNMFGVHEKNESSEVKFTHEDLGDLIALEGVKKYPVRIKCALLSANTLLQSLEIYEKKRGESK